MTDPSEMSGVLPAQAIRRLAAAGGIVAADGIPDATIQPASLDLRLGTRAWRVRASFLAGAQATVAERLEAFAMHQIDLAPGAVLETGCVYVVELQERLALPAGVSAAANAKSSTGRLDLFTRLIHDRSAEFDRVAPGYAGPLYAEITPRTFSVLVRPGARLNQIRFRAGASAALSDAELGALHGRDPLVAGDAVEALIDGGLGFSVDLMPGRDGLVGWRARNHAGLIDLDRIGHYAVRDFWEPVTAQTFGTGTGIILDPGAFYILMSREAVSVPPDHAAEMVPYMAAGRGRVPGALRRLLRPRLRPRRRGRRGLTGRARGPACHEATVRAGARPARRPAGLRAHGRDAGDPLRPRHRLHLSGPQSLKLSKHFAAP